MNRILQKRQGKQTAVCLAAALAAALLAGCGGAGKYELAADTAASEVAMDGVSYAGADYGLYDNGTYVMEAPAETAETEYSAEGSAEAAAPDGTAQLTEESAQTDSRKLIRTVDLYTETEQYDALLADLEAQITALGGYVEYRYQYNGNQYDDPDFQRRSCNLTVRIPADRLDAFIGKVGEVSNIVNKEERVEDVTLRYVDMESHRNSLRVEQERLTELLARAETVEDLITIESRLSEVRYELESMESQLRTLQNQVSYSTVNMNVQEVKRLTPVEEKGIWGRIRQGLSDNLYNLGRSLQNGFVGVIVSLPYIVCWLIALAVLLLVLRAVRKLYRKHRAGRGPGRFLRRRAKKAERTAEWKMPVIGEEQSADGNGTEAQTEEKSAGGTDGQEE